MLLEMSALLGGLIYKETKNETILLFKIILIKSVRMSTFCSVISVLFFLDMFTEKLEDADKKAVHLRN